MGGQSRLRTFGLSPRGRTWLARGLGLVGFAFLAKVLVETGLAIEGGRGGLDATDYWMAARRLADGTPIYAVEYGSFLAYSYPPPFAQLLTPFLILPAWAFVWIWRAVEILCLRYVLGSWARSGIAILVFPPLIAEIETGNIHLLMAAICVAVMRGTASPVVPAALLKFASIPLAPLGWFRDRRGLIAGAIVAFGITVVSVLTAPGYWAEYIRFLTTSDFPTGAYNVAAAIPVPLRLALSAVLGIAAVRWARLAPIAVVLAYPVVWFHALSTLVAIAAPIPARVPQRISRELPHSEVAPRAWQELPS